MNNRGIDIVDMIVPMLIAFFLLVVGVIVYHDINYTNLVSSLGYEKADVEAFCSSTGISASDIYKSKAMRKQFEKFVNGEDSEFLKQARAKHGADEARNSGMAMGMAVGVGAGMAANSGR